MGSLSFPTGEVLMDLKMEKKFNQNFFLLSTFAKPPYTPKRVTQAS